MKRIEELIKERGYNMTTFAEKMGTTRQNLYAILRSPSYPTLEKVATTLNVPIWQLFASPEEIAGKEELTALIRFRGQLYQADTVAELKDIVKTIESNI